MAGAQFHNLILIATIYLLVMIIEDQYSPGEGDSWAEVVNGFFHYLLLGFFSSNYWALILVLSITYDITQLKGILDAGNKLMALAVSSKYLGLFAGIALYRIYPYKIDLLSFFAMDS